MINNSININKVNNHLSPKESLNSDDQQLYQYQQNHCLSFLFTISRWKKIHWGIISKTNSL